mmetsp:Transcript_125408/g.401615  ORF Transcript_125408/g.401615 Transcript_125408/m.401615 type:complete len:257 (+) Transcript_125408:192-962(+)
MNLVGPQGRLPGDGLRRVQNRHRGGGRTVLEVVVELAAVGEAAALKQEGGQREADDEGEAVLHLVRQILVEREALAAVVVFMPRDFRASRAPIPSGRATSRRVGVVAIVKQGLHTHVPNNCQHNVATVAETSEAVQPAEAARQIRVLVLGAKVAASGHEQGQADANNHRANAHSCTADTGRPAGVHREVHDTGDDGEDCGGGRQAHHALRQPGQRRIRDLDAIDRLGRRGLERLLHRRAARSLSTREGWGHAAPVS